MPSKYDAVLLVSFGGPEGPDEVMPFLENVLRGKNVPRERMLEVAEHYQQFGGVSPINEQNRKLLSALQSALGSKGPQLPIYWGNRNWHPLLTDTLRQMADDGIRSALAVVTSAFSSYSGCRQYREDIARAQEAVGPTAPTVDKMRVYFNHPRFVLPMAERVAEALERLPASARERARIVFTAHSIPLSMAEGCRYELQLNESCRLVAEQLGRDSWDLVYQSRSGPPSQPWLEPDICDHLCALHGTDGICGVVIAPIGFVSDHMEVLFDLDTEARDVCAELGLPMQRAATVGTHPDFVEGLRQMIEERACGQAERPALGRLGASHDVCPLDCCLPGARPPRPASAPTG